MKLIWYRHAKYHRWWVREKPIEQQLLKAGEWPKWLINLWWWCNQDKKGEKEPKLP